MYVITEIVLLDTHLKCECYVYLTTSETDYLLGKQIGNDHTLSLCILLSTKCTAILEYNTSTTILAYILYVLIFLTSKRKILFECIICI